MRTAGWTPLGYGAVTLLKAADGGAYPNGNSLLIHGSAGTLLVDPALALAGSAPQPAADAVFVSHAHEDHMVDVGTFTVPVHVHEADLGAVRDIDVLLAGYGLPVPAAEAFGSRLGDDFRVRSRPDAVGVSDDHRFDLGDRTVSVVHLPGHTAGHSGLLVEPDGFFYVADIDLSSFGPFYGDVGSSLEDFEQSIDVCAGIEARWYGTFHHKGVIEGAEEFRSRLRTYRAVMERRDAELISFLAEPRTLAEVVSHRFVYRPHVDEPYVETVEARTAEQHIARLVRIGAVAEVEPGRFRAVVH
ncbi:Glyoxylase, beta-lactamase superfamily II [Haloechinothrix alba]|uniref:Glyoxylase, beta-lactamase superfamily II n=1 Tax=Haloechinothrix alba TaxID=664784 RepID=A0A239A9C2_9PSEU|nr:MBL fold metallo-hydrolase [Haloechinothrix alba]SNR92012.1 Glyoxylase, beta-lactamase superfamily II [Haloechinothrix alba]